MNTKYEFEEVARYLVDDKFVVKKIEMMFGLHASALIAEIAAGQLPECQGHDLFNVLGDLLHSDARIYRRFTARGSFGNYPIDIRGLGGVYFYKAPEFDLIGYFLTIDDADSKITLNWNDNLTSCIGRNYREPFFNEKLAEIFKNSEVEENPNRHLPLLSKDEPLRVVVASKNSNDRENLHQAKLFLSKVESSLDLATWQELLGSAPIKDTQVCASLLERWFDSKLDFSNLTGANPRNLFRLTLDSEKSVFINLIDRGRGDLIQQIRMTADREVEVLSRKLKNTHGVARMALAPTAQALGAATDRSKSINIALQAIASIEVSESKEQKLSVPIRRAKAETAEMNANVKTGVPKSTKHTDVFSDSFVRDGYRGAVENYARKFAVDVKTGFLGGMLSSRQVTTWTFPEGNITHSGGAWGHRSSLHVSTAMLRAKILQHIGVDLSKSRIYKAFSLPDQKLPTQVAVVAKDL